MADISVSGTTNPYSITALTPQQNDKNTLSMTDFFQLIATQLQYQDPTSPMDNNELMAQMTQMAMVQSLIAMTDSMKTSTAVTTQTYAAGLIGQEVTVAVTEENEYGQAIPTGVKYGKVCSVNLSGETPTVRLEGDSKDYPLSYIMGMGKIDDPYAEKKDEDGNGSETNSGTDKNSESGTAGSSMKEE